MKEKNAARNHYNLENKPQQFDEGLVEKLGYQH